MKRLTLNFIFFVFFGWLALATGKSYADDSSSTPEAFNLEDDLKACAMKLISNPEEIAKLRPSYGECRQIAVDQSSAIRLWHYSVGFYDFVSTEGGLSVAERPDDVSVQILPKNFYGLKQCHEKLSEKFQSNESWYMVTFKKGEKQVGIFSGFARINQRWVLVPRFNQAFSKGKTPPLYQTVLKMLSDDMPGDLFDLCSPRITEQMTRNDAAAFFAKLGVSEIKDLEMKSRGSKRINDFSQIHYGMNVDFEDGRAAAINMIFDRFEDGSFGLAWIAMQSRLGVEPPSLFAPLPDKCRQLSRNLYQNILAALENQDFQKLHEQSAAQIRNNFSVEQLRDAFPPKNEVLAQLPLLDPETVTLSSPPSLGRRDAFTVNEMSFRPENDRVPAGPLMIKAYFSTKDGKQTVAANFEFTFEDDKWKPSSYTFQLPPKPKDK